MKCLDASKKSKVAASITIHDAAKMTPKGRKDIANWLRQQAKNLLKESSNYSTRFRASYLYV